MGVMWGFWRTDAAIIPSTNRPDRGNRSKVKAARKAARRKGK